MPRYTFLPKQSQPAGLLMSGKTSERLPNMFLREMEPPWYGGTVCRLEWEDNEGVIPHFLPEFTNMK
jgi:hypothetical protein